MKCAVNTLNVDKIARQVKGHIRSTGDSFRTMAAKTGVAASTLHAAVHAQTTGRVPQAHTLVRISKGLRIKRSDLF